MKLQSATLKLKDSLRAFFTSLGETRTVRKTLNALTYLNKLDEKLTTYLGNYIRDQKLLKAIKVLICLDIAILLFLMYLVLIFMWNIYQCYFY